MAKFKLFYDKKPIVISYKNPSGKLSLLFARELNKLQIADNASKQQVIGIILSKYIDATDTTTPMEIKFISAMQRAFEAGDITADQMQESMVTTQSTPEDIENDFKIYINLFKEMVDFSELNPTNKELLSSDWDSDFWMAQNLQEVKAQVLFFRQSNL